MGCGMAWAVRWHGLWYGTGGHRSLSSALADTGGSARLLPEPGLALSTWTWACTVYLGQSQKGQLATLFAASLRELSALSQCQKCHMATLLNCACLCSGRRRHVMAKDTCGNSRRHGHLRGHAVNTSLHTFHLITNSIPHQLSFESACLDTAASPDLASG